LASHLAGAICGQFVVGDGTVVSTPYFACDKASLTLRAKPYTVATGTITTIHLGKARLTLAAKTYVLFATSVVTTGKARLTLAARPFLPIIPVQVHVGRANLILASHPYTFKLDQTLPVNKASLILVAGEIKKVGKTGLIPTHCVEVTLVPTTYVTV
jgi:hypothetical protein